MTAAGSATIRTALSTVFGDIAASTTMRPMLPAGFPREISKEAMNELPIRRYEGEVRIVETAADLERAGAELLAPGVQRAVTGFDTETRPAFAVGESYLPSLAQVAGAHAVYL